MDWMVASLPVFRTLFDTLVVNGHHHGKVMICVSGHFHGVYLCIHSMHDGHELIAVVILQFQTIIVITSRNSGHKQQR
jgi:hypothetical protein